MINFILPAILTVTAFGNYKQYILYISFTYFFNFGYNDGIYIKYGGKNLEDLPNETVINEHNFLIAFQMMVLIVMLLLGLIKKDLIFIFFSIATFFDMINTYHSNFLQATGQFKVFSNGNILKSIYNILILLIFIFIVRTDNFIAYILINISAYAFLTLYYEIKYLKTHKFSFFFDLKNKFNLFKVGFLILFSNMSLTFVANVGNWVVNSNYDIETFAQYSFQNSLLNVILLIVNAVGMVFYNVISKKSSKKILNYIKQACLYLGVISGLAYFVFKVIVIIFLPDYIPSLNLLSITFISIPYIMISRILVANLYKTKTSPLIYFRDSATYAGLSFVFVYLCDLLFNNLKIVALATTISYMLWFIYTTYFKFSDLKISLKEILLLISHFTIFYITANMLGSITGLIVYLIYSLAIIGVNRSEIKQFINGLY